MCFVFYSLTGMLGALTCVLCSFLGAEAAKVLLIFPANSQRISRWLTWSLLTVNNTTQGVKRVKIYVVFRSGTSRGFPVLVQN